MYLLQAIINFFNYDYWVCPRFYGMRDESSNLRGIWDERTFNDRMQMGKNVLAGVGCALFDKLDKG